MTNINELCIVVVVFCIGDTTVFSFKFRVLSMVMHAVGPFLFSAD
jgi:hypothetical protein